MNWKVFALAGVSVVGLVLVGILLFAIPVFPFKTIVNLSQNKQVAGTVYDCASNLPVQGATVTMSGTGWGLRNNSLVWDKVYSSSVLSLPDGSFSLDYELGTELTVEMNGYIKSLKHTDTASNLQLGLVKKNSENESELYSYDCKVQSECMKTEIINEVETTWDACANPKLYTDIK